ncbi:MAG: hypothetical protein MUF78_10145, partial [Candidatus Edwardsbacteria bacterium]|nr:hypothetical protein [Candidatus Edwardsbacteria bacterium]
AMRGRVEADSIVTSGDGHCTFAYRVVNEGGTQLPAVLRLRLRDTTGIALDSLVKPCHIAPGDTAVDRWQSAPGCGRYRLDWRLALDSSGIVLDSSSLMVDIVPGGSISLDSLVLEPCCDSTGQAIVRLHATNRSPEPFTGSFVVVSDIGYWRQDRPVAPHDGAEITFRVPEQVDAGMRRFVAAGLTGGDTVASLTRMLRFAPALQVDSLPGPIETEIGDTLEFSVSLINLGNAVSRDTLVVSLGDICLRRTELLLPPGTRHTERYVEFIPDDLEDQTVQGFVYAAPTYHPLRANLSGYGLDVSAILDRPFYRPGDTIGLALAMRSTTDRNLACLISGVYGESALNGRFRSLGAMSGIDLTDPERLIARRDTAWYVSGLIEPGICDSITAGSERSQIPQSGLTSAGKQPQIALRATGTDSVTSGPWSARVDSARYIQYRLRLATGDTVERVRLHRYVGGVCADTVIELFDSAVVRHALAWPFDPGQGQQALISYGIHTESGRSLWLNTAYVYRGHDSLTVWPGRQLYAGSDTAVFHARAAVGGTLRYAAAIPPFPTASDTIIVVPGDTSFGIVLPSQQASGTRYLAYSFAVNGDTANLIEGTVRFDVEGYRIRVHDWRLTSPTWRPGDTLTAAIRLHASQQVNADLMTRIYCPGGISGPAETTSVALAGGYQWLVLRRQIPSMSPAGTAQFELAARAGFVDLGAQRFSFDVINPDTTPPSAWFTLCPANTYECQLPYALALHRCDDRGVSDTVYYDAGGGWVALLPDHRSDSVSAYLIPPQPRGTAISYYAKVGDAGENTIRVPVNGCLTFHVLPALPPGDVTADTADRGIDLGWRPPQGELAYHRYSPEAATGLPAAPGRR